MPKRNAKQPEEQPNPNRFEELKANLIDRRKALQSEVVTQRSDRTLPSNRADSLDVARDDIESGIESMLTQQKSETIDRINNALLRLTEGTYGLCIDCGEEIEQKRLRALPFAVRCMDCETSREEAIRQERQRVLRRNI